MARIEWDMFQKPHTLCVIGRLEGWKIGSARFHPSILPVFQSVKSFPKKFETCPPFF